MNSSKTMTLRPSLSEKTYALSNDKNVYVFIVPGSANKKMVSDAVAAQFGVTVETVNIVNQKGKTKRTVRKGGRPIMGRQVDRKKAYVSVKTGDSIPVFASLEEAEKKQEKTEKAMAKAQAKEEKK